MLLGAGHKEATVEQPTPEVHSAALPQVEAVVRAARRRLWQAETASRVLRWGAVPLLAVAAWLAAIRWLDWLPERSDVVCQAVLAVGILGSWVWALGHRSVLMDVAMALDRRSASHDAFSTALWLAQQGRRDGWASVQQAHAGRLAASIDVASLWPMPSWRQARPLAAAVLVLAAVSVWPPPSKAPHVVADALGVEARWPSGHVQLASARQVLGEDAADLLRADLRLLREVEDQVADPSTRKWLRALRDVVESVQAGRIDKRQALEQLAALEANRPSDEGASAETSTAAASEAAEEQQRQRDVAARDAILQAASQAIGQAPAGETKQAIEQAVEQGDVGLLAKALEQLAQRDLSDKDIEKWRKTLEKFADSLRDRKVPEKLRQLAERVRRLEDQRARQGGLNPSDQRRLQEARHDLEQLRKESGDIEGAQHQVQRLERQARQAADALRRQQSEAQSRLDKGGDGGGQGEAAGGQRGSKTQQAMREVMRRAADELRRQDDQHKARQAQRVGQQRLRDLREGLSRGQGGGRDPSPEGGSDQQAGQRSRDAQGPSRLQRGGQGERGQGETGQGERGEDESGQDQGDPDGADTGKTAASDKTRQPKAAQADSSQRGKRSQGRDNSGDSQAADGGQSQSAQAGAGQRAKDKGFRLGSKGLGGKSRTELINDGYDQGDGASGDGGKGGRQAGAGQGGNEAGSGAGEGGNQGRQSGLKAARTEKIQGVQGEGPDVKQTFLDAARKGFARQGWREVYADYSQVAEEMLDKESLPPGRKALVRRYFEQIRPRP